MKIGVIGAGRLGICFALLLEKAGYDVIVSDCRDDYVIGLNNRIINTNEPQVAEMLDDAKNFNAVLCNIEVIKQCDIIYTLVATPSLSSGDYDVSAVWQVIDDFKNCPFPVSGKTLVVGCTTNPGDCDEFQSQLSAYGVDVFYNPEFIAQGSIVKDLQYADMVLVGGHESKVYEHICDIYRKIQISEPKINLMSNTAAEIVKLAVNCFLTTKISYANMVGEVMTLAGLENEIDHVLKAIGSDTRVGSKYLKYGYGFGGPCLPRDNRSFSAYAKKLGLQYNLGMTTDNFNEEHSKFLFNYFINKNTNKSIPFCFDYISYKKGTDIITESQQYKLCTMLLDAGYEVYVIDNEAVISKVKKELCEKYYDRVKFFNSRFDISENVFDINL
jgi:nucleotide sugar dehydrogenase